MKRLFPWMIVPVFVLACSPAPSSPSAPSTSVQPSLVPPPPPPAAIVQPAAPAASGNGELLIDAFQVLEVQYSPASGWSYAPRAHVTPAAGIGSVTITSIDVAIPGFGRSPSCLTDKHVPPGGRDVFGTDGYGDFEIAYDDRGRRAAGGDATLLLAYVVDATGANGQVSVTGAIGPGLFPTYGAPSTLDGGCHLPTSTH